MVRAGPLAPTWDPEPACGLAQHSGVPSLAFLPPPCPHRPWYLGDSRGSSVAAGHSPGPTLLAVYL